ncbi:hypothetical protein B0O99DRAFT_685254 [Bisporella sp. PMI_857]|nr:hypothetical protein B0O99DRAFT_685254 [Bisporella sp. PMI_857]
MLDDLLVDTAAVFSRNPNANRHSGASYHAGDITSPAELPVVGYVFTSSTDVYENDENRECYEIKEDSPLVQAPLTEGDPYKLSKEISDTMVIAASDRFQANDERELRTVCLLGFGRLQLEDNSTIFDPIYVGNAVDGHTVVARALLEEAEAGTQTDLPEHPPMTQGEALNMTDDHRASFWDYVHQLYAAVGYPQPPERI